MDATQQQLGPTECNTPAKQTEHRSPGIFDSAVFLAIATAMSYAIAFSYEFGYAAFFQLPPSIVDVNIKGLLLCGGSFALILAYGSTILQLVATMLPRHKGLRFSLLTTFAPAGTVILLPLLIHEDQFPFYVPLIACGIFGAWAFVFLPLTKKRGTPYLERLMPEEIRIKKGMQPFRKFMLKNKGRNLRIYVAIMVSGIAILFANIRGTADAQVEERFLVPTTGDPCAVVRNYGEALICVSFEPRTRRFKAEYRFLTTHEAQLALRMTKIGPLTSAVGGAIFDGFDMLKHPKTFTDEEIEFLLKEHPVDP